AVDGSQPPAGGRARGAARHLARVGARDAGRTSGAHGARVAGDGMRTVGRSDRRTVGLCILTVTAVLSDGLTVRQSARWRPEDRALISDFSAVEAVAASPFSVFAATTHGLTIYDRQARTWRLPVTSLDGYPAARVRVALADGVADAVWLGTAGGWGRYDATVRTWEQGGVPGGAAGPMVDARHQARRICVEGASGWGVGRRRGRGSARRRVGGVGGTGG